MEGHGTLNLQNPDKVDLYTSHSLHSILCGGQVLSGLSHSLTGDGKTYGGLSERLIWTRLMISYLHSMSYYSLDLDKSTHCRNSQNIRDAAAVLPSVHGDRLHVHPTSCQLPDSVSFSSPSRDTSHRAGLLFYPFRPHL